MDQTRALTALAPYLALAKSATSPRAASDLITQATSAPNTYVFGELLQKPTIHALSQDSQYSRYHLLLQIFAWGTWREYEQDANLPPLSDQQEQKLKLLSLLSCAAASTPDLSYAALISELGLVSSAELEALVTKAIYASLLTATLDPSAQRVLITSIAPLRDLAPASIPSLLSSLDAWSQRCDAVLTSLQAEIADVEVRAMKQAKAEARREKQISVAVEEGKSSGAPSQANSRATRGQRIQEEEDGDAMEVDGESGRGKKRSVGGNVFGGIVGKMAKGAGR